MNRLAIYCLVYTYAEMRESLYIWWKRQPKTVRKPFVLTLGLFLVVISPFTGILPGPGGIPIFLLGVAILASEFDWADRFKKFMLHHMPTWIRRYWRFTPKWLNFFDICALVFVGFGIFFSWHQVELPKFAGQRQPPFLTILDGSAHPWWIFAGTFALVGVGIFFTNRNRIAHIKRWARTFVKH